MRENDISIFLCGGSKRIDEKLRKTIGNKLSKKVSKYKYTIFYPESIFMELLLGHNKKNLLELEGFLAQNVNVVVILLQSPGTFTELGAFSNNILLSNKLVVITKTKYKNKRSFINYGPIRYLMNESLSKIIYSKLEFSEIDALVEQITTASISIFKSSSPKFNLTNPLIAYDYYLVLIYVFDPIKKNVLLKIVSNLIDNDDSITHEKIDNDDSIILEEIDNDDSMTLGETVLNSLKNERKISFNYKDNSISITKKGINSLLQEQNTKKRYKNISTVLTKYRLMALNYTLRRKYKEYME